MNNDEFEALTTDESRYPHSSGDFIVIGPQCFAAKDETVLNWKGVNYVLQDAAEALAADLSSA
jgi:hypothetical protein